MINQIYYLIGFLIYSTFCIFTFNTFFKIEDETKKKAGLLIIYIFYSVLAAYIIHFCDINVTTFEKAIQTLIYVIGEGVFLWFYYKDILIGNTEQYR